MTSTEPVFEFSLDLAGPDKAGPSEGRAAAGRARRLHDQLRAAILDRRLRPGSELPSTRRVAAAYGIARNTVIAAYDLLMSEGYVTTRAGAKAVVVDVGAKPAKPSRRAPPLMDERLNPQWRLPAWTTLPPGTDAPAQAFELGTPDCRQFPFDVWRRLLSRSFNPRQPATFGYQPPNGRPVLRSAIAQHVSFARAVVCGADDVIVTCGAQQAFSLLAGVLVTPGRTRVAVEDPGYPPLRAAMAVAGAQIVAVPVDNEGLCVDRLPEDVRIVYVTPSHQFPTGVPMSMARRAALLAFARKHGAVIIEDDYDGEFRYGQRPLDALQTLDRDASVVYVGTFSKSLFPSLRIGYVVAPAWLREAFAAIRQCADTAGNAQVQEALGRFILDGHLARHVRRMRKTYAARREAVLKGIGQALRPWFDAVPSEAGIHLSMRHRDPGAARLILPKLRQVMPGARSFADYSIGADTQAGVALGFGGIEADAIDASLKALAEVLARR